MDTFLHEVASRLIAEHPNDLQQVCVIFNNKRPSLFLRKEFKQICQQATFLPSMLSMDELVKELGGLDIIPNEFLLFELFDIHNKVSTGHEGYETFEKFISLADMMLTDFSELDQYMVDAEKLFSNLHDTKRLGEWNIDGSEQTEMQKRYLAFYASLYQYYTLLHKRLREQKKAYSGMAYRNVAENIGSMIDKLPYKHIYFVGFNVLSTCHGICEKACERIIIDAFLKSGKASIITDGDKYYYEDKNQEAGKFLRELNQWIPRPIEHPDHFSAEPKKISVASCPENILQAVYAGHLLSDKAYNPNELESTAIVLADENLLIPVLNALPANIEKANVTMGFPFLLTNIYSFALKILSLHKRSRRKQFFYSDLISILSDSYACILLNTTNLHTQIQKKLAEDSIIYADAESIEQILNGYDVNYEDVSFLFQDIEGNPYKLLAIYKQLYQKVLEHKERIVNAKEREALTCFIEIVNYFDDLQQKYSCIDDFKTFEKIYTRISQRHSVPFYGEPLGGLQILGMLETRNLSFERLIILSVNEGILPTGRGNNTLIPYSLKRAYGIPTFEEKDAVYAYNFYRLIQRAREITLVYNTETDGMNKGEPSRYLLQIRHELVPTFPNITLEEKILSVVNKGEGLEAVTSVEKDDYIMGRIKALAAKGISPSALNMYRNCPLQFLYKYVYNLQETQEVSEELQSTELGTCIHDILNDIYGKDEGGKVRIETLKDSLQNIEAIVTEKIESEFLKGRDETGRNVLSKMLAINEITALLEHDIEDLKEHTLQIKELEKEISAELAITIDDKQETVKLAGRADRIDVYDNVLRIIDYKSGNVEASKLTSTSPLIRKSQMNQLFQILLYAWIYSRTKTISNDYKAGILPLRHLTGEVLYATYGTSEILDDKALNTFETELADLLTELLDPERPMRAWEDSTNCMYCAFKSICGVFDPVSSE